eukprot:6214543-Pleurochrysis_carterae.AAC.2
MDDWCAPALHRASSQSRSGPDKFNSAHGSTKEIIQSSKCMYKIRNYLGDIVPIWPLDGMTNLARVSIFCFEIQMNNEFLT